jgi:hypothetical protein
MAKLLLKEILVFSCVGVFFAGTVLGAAHLLANPKPALGTQPTPRLQATQ